MSKKNLAVIFGGLSQEHEVSIMSAVSVCQAADREKYNIFPLAVTKDGNWLTPADSALVLRQEGMVGLSKENKVGLCRINGKVCIFYMTGEAGPIPIDVVFPLFHGPYGEDGSIQGMCKFLGVPCVGAGVLASAVSMDKSFMKSLFAVKSLPQTDYYVIEEYSWRREQNEIINEMLQVITYPLFVKPAGLGSSVGTSKVLDGKTLPVAIEEAFEFDEKVIIERFVEGRELECAVLGNRELKVAGPGEIIYRREFYDFAAKYTKGETRLLLEPCLDPSIKKKIRELALQAFRAVECKGMGRVDFFLTSENEIFINEINTIPGFTEFSMYPKLWAMEGLNLTQLIDALIELAIVVK